MWRTLHGDPVDELIDTIRELTLEDDECVLHLGTDSQVGSRGIDFVTVVCIIRPGHGGRIFHRRSRMPRGMPIATRLMHEAELSLEVARELDVEFANDIVVHVDANQDPRYRSSNYVQSLAGMVVGNGFRVQLKPNSWCATHVADHVVRSREVHVA